MNITKPIMPKWAIPVALMVSFTTMVVSNQMCSSSNSERNTGSPFALGSSPPEVDTYVVIAVTKPEIVTKKSIMIWEGRKDTLVTENNQFIRFQDKSGIWFDMKYKHRDIDEKLLSIPLPDGFCFEITCDKNQILDNKDDFILSFVMKKLEPEKHL